MVEYLGIETQIYDFEENGLSDGSYHESHVMGEPMRDSIKHVVKDTWSDLESLLLVTKERILKVLSRNDGAHKIMVDLIGRFYLKERQSGVVDKVS